MLKREINEWVETTEWNEKEFGVNFTINDTPTETMKCFGLRSSSFELRLEVEIVWMIPFVEISLDCCVFHSPYNHMYASVRMCRCLCKREYDCNRESINNTERDGCSALHTTHNTQRICIWHTRYDTHAVDVDHTIYNVEMLIVCWPLYVFMCFGLY